MASRVLLSVYPILLQKRIIVVVLQVLGRLVRKSAAIPATKPAAKPAEKARRKESYGVMLTLLTPVLVPESLL